jgi:hypothetical protein
MVNTFLALRATSFPFTLLEMARFVIQKSRDRYEVTMAATGVTINTVPALINDLVVAVVLREMTGQRRNRLFVFQEYLALFKS